MISYEKGDIVLVPFPFTDLSTNKKRPGLVISPAVLNRTGDVTLAFITSQLAVLQRPGDCEIRDWRPAGLPKPSMTRMKVVTLSSGLIIKRLGRLSERDKRTIFGTIRRTFG